MRSNLLSREPLPSLNKALQQVIQEEPVRGNTQEREEPATVVGFAIRGLDQSRVDKTKNYIAPTVIQKGMIIMVVFFYMVFRIGILRNLESKREEIKNKAQPTRGGISMYMLIMLP